MNKSFMKEVWSLRHPDSSLIMDITNILKAENASNSEIQVAISTMDFISTPTPATELPTADTVSEALQQAVTQFEVELNNFMTAAFPATTKGLKPEKKDALAILGVTSQKKEFRLPSRLEVKPAECAKASEAWIALKSAHHKLALAILTTIHHLERGSKPETPSTIEWTSDDVNGVTAQAQDAVKKLLLAGVLLSILYSKALTKAQLEFSRTGYNKAFENLKAYRIPRSIKTARRKARQSEEYRKEAVELLDEEQGRYHAIVIKWDEECDKWESRRQDTGTRIFQEQQRIVNKSMGIPNLQSVLPETAEIAEDVVKDILRDLIPSVEVLEDQLTSHEQEAEEITDMMDEEFNKMRESLEPNERMVEREGPRLPVHQSTPKQRGVSFDLPNSVLFHDNIALNNALAKLGTAYNVAKERRTEESREILKARAEMARS